VHPWREEVSYETTLEDHRASHCCLLYGGCRPGAQAQPARKIVMKFGHLQATDSAVHLGVLDIEAKKASLAKIVEGIVEGFWKFSGIGFFGANGHLPKRFYKKGGEHENREHLRKRNEATCKGA